MVQMELTRIFMSFIYLCRFGACEIAAIMDAVWRGDAHCRTVSRRGRNSHEEKGLEEPTTLSLPPPSGHLFLCGVTLLLLQILSLVTVTSFAVSRISHGALTERQRRLSVSVCGRGLRGSRARLSVDLPIDQTASHHDHLLIPCLLSDLELGQRHIWLRH